MHRQIDCNDEYSQEELKIIEENYSLYGPKYCAALLQGRSAQSVKSKANKKLNLKYRVKFTEEAGFNIQLFKKYYKNHSIQETAQYFNLTEGQVIGLAARSKVKRDRATIKTGVVPQAVICVELNKDFESAKQAGETLNLGGA